MRTASADEAGDEHHDRDGDEERGEQVPELALLGRRPSRSPAAPSGARVQRERQRDLAVRRGAAEPRPRRRRRRYRCRSACRRRRRRARRGRPCPRARARAVAGQLDRAAQARRAGHEPYSPVYGAGRRGPLGARSRRLARELGLQRRAAHRAGHAPSPTVARSAASAVEAVDVAGQAGRPRSAACRRRPVRPLQRDELARLAHVDLLAQARVALAHVVAAGDRWLRLLLGPAESTSVATTATATTSTTK